jgi:hypothetical protein
MNIAQGSLEECHYYLLLAKDFGWGLNIEIEYRIQNTVDRIKIKSAEINSVENFPNSL